MKNSLVNLGKAFISPSAVHCNRLFGLKFSDHTLLVTFKLAERAIKNNCSPP